MAEREVVRTLTPAEVAIISPAVEDAVALIQAAAHAKQLSDQARAALVAMVGLLNGGADPTVQLDQEKWELVRVPPGANGAAP